MTIYIDILLITNLFINFLILQITDSLLNCNSPFLRLILGSTVGAVSSLIILLPEMDIILSLLLKLFFAVIIIFISFKISSFRRLMSLLFTFFLSSLLFAGILFALWMLFLPTQAQFSNGVVYLDISPLLLIVSSTVCYGVVTLLEKLFMRKTPKSSTADLTVAVGTKKVKLHAFVDSGNYLRDAITGLPCIVAEFGALKPLFDSKTANIMQSADPSLIHTLSKDWSKRIRIVSYDSIGGSGLLLAFRPDKVEALGLPVECIIAVQNRPIMRDGCNTILPPELISSDTTDLVCSNKAK